jgi:hypothetical protein
MQYFGKNKRRFVNSLMLNLVAMRTIFLCVLLAYLYSCNNKNSNEQSTGKQDAKSETHTVFTENNFKKLQLPLKTDTTFVDKADTNSRLTYHDLREMGSRLFMDDAIKYNLTIFCKIDSLKEKKLYQAYVDSLDIGMTKNSIAFKVGYAELKNGSRLFLWGTESSSYEACPVFSEKNIIATYINAKGEMIETFLLAKRFSGADPPSTGREDVMAEIDAEGNIKQTGISISDDLDIPGEEIIIVNTEIKLADTKAEKKEIKKEVKNTEAKSEDN